MLTRKTIELVLNTIGRIKNPNYEKVRDSVMLNQDFVDELADHYDEYFEEDGTPIREVLPVEEVEQVHRIAMAIGNKEEAISLILEEQSETPSEPVTEERQTQAAPTSKAASGPKSAMAKAEAIQKKRAAGEAKAAEIRRAREEEFSQLSNAVNVYSKIYDYTVVRKKMKHELVDEVKSLMQRGWVPYGGVAYAAAGMSPVGNTGNTFLQAMVRIKK